LRPPAQVLHDLEADVCVGQPLTQDPVPGPLPLTCQTCEIAEADRAAAADQHTLRAQRRLGDAPPAVHLADHVLVRDPHVGQEHLVEVGDAVDLAQWPHVDPGRTHVEHEVRDALMLRGV
jgi:hypothetical protein